MTIDELYTKLNADFGGRFDRMESRFDRMESRFDRMESRIANLESDTKALKEETHRINLKIDNDVDRRLDALATKDDLQDELLHPMIDDSVNMRCDPLEARVAALEAGFKVLKLKVG